MKVTIEEHEHFKDIQTYVIISGTMPVTRKYVKDIEWWYGDSEKGTVLALMAGFASERQNFAFLDVFGKLDFPKPMFTREPTAMNFNWPSFAFTCYTDKNGPMIPNPTIGMSVATVRSQPSYEADRRWVHFFAYYRKCANELEFTSAITENFKANTAIKNGVSLFRPLPVAVHSEEREALGHFLDGNLQSKIAIWKAWAAEGNKVKQTPVKEERVEAF